MKPKRGPVMMSVLFSLTVVLAGCAHSLGDGWITLIDGETGLDNWNRIGDANWRAEGGAIVANRGKGGYLVSKNTYKDFEIRAEFWAESSTNSGIFIRCADPAKITAADCYEVNIWDTRPELNYATGAIVNHAAVPVPIIYKAAGKWSTFEITAKGCDIDGEVRWGRVGQHRGRKTRRRAIRAPIWPWRARSAWGSHQMAQGPDTNPLKQLLALPACRADDPTGRLQNRS